MAVQRLEPGANIGARRGEVVVCVSVVALDEHFVGCLQSVLTSTPTDVKILVCEHGGSEPADLGLEQARPIEHELFYGGLAAAAPADVIVLRSDCEVPPGWVARLRDAALLDSTVATATPLSDQMLADGQSLEQADAAVSAASLRLRPRTLTPAQGCIYIRRTALELAGDFDRDFARRCVRLGLTHVVADDLLVVHHGAGAAADGKPTTEEPPGPLARSFGIARRAVDGLSVVLDARILAGAMNGTQLHVSELIAAIARTGEARVTALVAPPPGNNARDALESVADVELVTVTGGVRRLSIPPADVVHRPFQVSSEHDLTLLPRLGGRFVITHQDLIGYRNPSYFRTSMDWEAYRHLTRRALAIADRTVFFSVHARDDAIAEDLVEPHRASVVQIGVDHTLAQLEREPRQPPALSPLPPDAELMICIGSDLRHKNRVFALRVLDELQQRHDWDGWLVFAGQHLELGSSAADERELLGHRQRVRDRALDVGAIDEGEKRWLLSRARLVLYPTAYEGFGLVPFEAAGHNLPCMWAQGTSLSEILPDAAATIVPWDAAASADAALELLRDERARERNVAAIEAAAVALTWETTASRMLEVYRAVCDGPPSPTAALERTAGLMHGGVSEDALRLVGPDGVLPRELERPLLALATHPHVGTPVFRAIKAGYRASSRWRRGRPDGNGGGP